MFVAAAKAIALLVLVTLAFVGGAALIAIAYLLLPEARPAMRDVMGITRRTRQRVLG